MALTVEQRQVWLSQDFHRIVIADIQFHDGSTLGTERFSSYPYVMPIGDTTTDPLDGITILSNLIYDDIISNIPNIINRIDQDSTIGSIDLLNTDGEYDHLLDETDIVGHPIRLFIGDTNWPRDNFIQILDGIVNSVASTSPENIQITLRDRKETLNVPLQTELLDHSVGGVWETLMADIVSAGIFVGSVQGTRPYAPLTQVLPEDIENTHVPICLGKCFNIEPVLVDSWNHVYMIHTSGDATIDSLVSVDEVRSNGIPLGINNSRSMLLTTTTGSFEIGDVITDDTDPLIWGTIYDITGVSPNQNIFYNINDLLHDFSVTTGTFTGVPSSAQAIAVDPVILDTKQYEVDLVLGVIRLLDHPSGTQITCDVVAQAARSSLVPGGSLALEPYSAAWIIEWILLEKAGTPFNDICQLTFPPTGSNGFDNISALGIYYKDEQTVLDIATKTINAVGGFLRFKDEFCKLQIIKLIDPATVADIDINLFLEADDIVENGVSIASIEEPKKSITLGYRKNWKTQDEGALAGALAEISVIPNGLELIDSYKNEYTTLYELTGVPSLEYPLAENVDLIETIIYETIDAQAELDRRIGLRSQKRRVIRIHSLATSFTFDVGDIVHITHSRFGLTQGKKAIIVGIEESLTNKRVTLDVWL